MPQDVSALKADTIRINSGSTVKDVAEYLGVAVPEIIKKLMSLGEMATLTQTLSDDAIQVIADEFDKEIEIVHASDEADAEPEFDDADDELAGRAPVVTIMGHVDHGKTSLLDAVRETEVAAGEAGGITQHIGAYQVHHDGKTITFLDTPGHEAFTAMRARGGQVADIAVIVVAADDGVMPQTREAIDHAKAAEVPMLVAVNKIDKEGAQPDRVRTEMTNLGLQPEEWGGETMFVDVSAKTRQNLDDLLESILLVAEVEELKANPDADASGQVIESKLDPGRGAVVTVLVQRGTLQDRRRRGGRRPLGPRPRDARLQGHPRQGGRPVRARRGARLRLRPRGRRVRARRRERPQGPPARRRARHAPQARAAGPPLRQEVLAGDDLRPAARRARQRAQPGAQGRRLRLAGGLRGRDRQAPAERGHGQRRPHRASAASPSPTSTWPPPPTPSCSASTSARSATPRQLADREGVEIRSYSVIYRAIDELRDAMQGMLAPEEVEETVGTAEVRAIFRASRIGTIAGSMVTDGKITRGAKVRLVRDGTIVYAGEIASLRRVNDDVREVLAGFECGIVLANFADVKEGDIIEAYETRQVERTLS